jgi:SAM-dependent methyltransferase
MDARDWDARYAASELVWSREPNQFVAAELADLPPGTAVDLAAGEGRNAIWLASRGWDATAVDFSQVALDKGARLAAEAGIEVTWARADATTWHPPAPVDLVVVAYLQLPADERRRAVRNAITMLRPGGTLLLVAHDSTNLTEGTGGPQDPSVLMTADDVLADLEGYDVDVLRAERVAREVRSADPAHHEHGGEERRTAWDCLVRVVRR